MTRPAIDWEAVEREYRAGVKTLRQIADEFGVSNPAIVKRAKRDGWARNLAAKIQAKAESLVSKQEVSNEVSKDDAISERQVNNCQSDSQSEILASGFMNSLALCGFMR